MIHFLSEHWLTILGASAVAWSLFALGREYEYDHPRDGFSFTPDESWNEITSYPMTLEREIQARRGVYDQDQER